MRSVGRSHGFRQVNGCRQNEVEDDRKCWVHFLHGYSLMFEGRVECVR
jgi:hypothetical protein